MHPKSNLSLNIRYALIAVLEEGTVSDHVAHGGVAQYADTAEGWDS